MDGIEEKLNSILGNPAMMQQIMSLAQSMGQGSETPHPNPEPAPAPMGDLDPAMLTKLMSLAGKTNIDPNQQALLKAMKPYLTQERISRLEKAMRAAKLATLAGSFLGSNTISGR